MQRTERISQRVLQMEGPHRERSGASTQGMDKQVKEDYDQSLKLYRSPKITSKLHQQGMEISKRTVMRIMNKQ